MRVQSDRVDRPARLAVSLTGSALLALALAACAVSGSDRELPSACAGSGAVSPPALPPPDRTLLVAGEEFDILIAGPATAEVVLLLQGFPDGSYDHHAALPRLANAGYRAIVAVRRGVVRAPAADSARPQQVLLLADALALGRFHVAGGELAWDVAKLAPQRVMSVARTPPAQVAAITALERAAAACPGAAQAR